MKKLMSYYDSYLDEFPVLGFVITDQEGYDIFMDICNDIRKIMKDDEIPDICVDFGINFSVGYETIDDLLSYIEVEDITDEEANVLTKLFGDGYGFFPGKYLSDWLHDMVVRREYRQ